jgi:transcriptional regulator with XRE-family HTH domain
MPSNDETYAKRLGESISRLLGMYLLTQAELGRQVAVSPQTMTNIVRGQAEARARTYQAIFEFFGLDRFVEDFEAALPDIVQAFPDVEKKAAAIRAKRSK